MDNKEILKALLRCKLNMADRIIERFPEDIGKQADRVLRSILTAVNEAVTEYMEQENPKPGDDGVKAIKIS